MPAYSTTTNAFRQLRLERKYLPPSVATYHLRCPHNQMVPEGAGKQQCHWKVIAPLHRLISMTGLALTHTDFPWSSKWTGIPCSVCLLYSTCGFPENHLERSPAETAGLFLQISLVAPCLRLCWLVLCGFLPTDLALRE